MRAVSEDTHPSADELALYSRSELPRLADFRIRLHLRKCARCRGQVLSLRQAVDETVRNVKTRFAHTESLPGWQRLQQEMSGNIAVGLAAAQCIEHVDARRRRLWIRVSVTGGLLALLVLAWISHIPTSDTARIFTALTNLGKPRTVRASVPILSSTIDGIAISSHQTGLKVLTPSAATVFCAGSKTLQASFVDEETGESTVVSVYER